MFREIKANNSSAFLGTFFSELAIILVSKTNIYFLYYGMVEVAVSFIGAYLFSFLFKFEKDVKGLTYSTINDKIVRP